MCEFEIRNRLQMNWSWFSDGIHFSIDLAGIQSAVVLCVSNNKGVMSFWQSNMATLHEETLLNTNLNNSKWKCN